LYNVLWGKNIEEKDEMNKIGASKTGLELELHDSEAQVPDDDAAKV
jgi:hypothetical protein